jgi:uncharacterized membrane-anchored protein
LGDWTADTAGLGYLGAALIFSGFLAAVGDFLDKPLDHGGLALIRPIATAVLAAAIVILIVALPRKSGRLPGGAAVGDWRAKVALRQPWLRRAPGAPGKLAPRA